jgi:hypothetical protein
MSRQHRPASIRTPPRIASRNLPEAQLSSSGFFEELGASAESYIGLDDAFWSCNLPFKALDRISDGFDPQARSNSASLAVEMAEHGCEVIRADGRCLWEIEDSITHQTTHLVLSGCKDPALFDFLERVLPGVASSLLVLDLSSTALHELPNCLHLCVRLEELNLSGNPALQAHTSNLEILARLGASLQLLNLDNSHLMLLPSSVMNLRNLRILSACDNQLTHLPSWLHRLQNLQRLVLSGNPFQGPWTSICEEFCRPLPSGLAMYLEDDTASTRTSLRTMGSNGTTLKRLARPSMANDEHLEELADESNETSSPDSPESVASLNVESSRGRTFKPFVRRMLSAGDLKGVLDDERKASLAEADSKWALLRRKVNSKSDGPVLKSSLGLSMGSASSSQISLAKVAKEISAGSPDESTGIVSRSFVPKSIRNRIASKAFKQCRADRDVQPAPAIATTDRSVKRLRPISFLPFGPLSDVNSLGSHSNDQELGGDVADEDAKHRKSVQVLLQYLEDLSDLNPVQRNLNIYLNRSSSVHDSGSSMCHGSTSSQRHSDVATSRISSVYSEVGSDASRTLPSFTDTKTSGSDHASDFKDDAKRRLHILREILSTEMTYVRNLRELIDLYVIPAAQLDSVTQLPIVPLHDRRQVFGNIEGILHFHSEAFAPALHEAAQCALDAYETAASEKDAIAYEKFQTLTARAAEQVARTFERHAAFFRMYAAYVNNVDTAQKCVASWSSTQVSSTTTVLRSSTARFTKRDGVQDVSPGSGGAHSKQDPSGAALSSKERKRLRLFLQQARLDSRHSQLSLEAYIHLPVQRIPRYRLLLEDLVRVCPPARLSGQDSIQTALDSTSSIACMMNESKRQSEMDRRLLYWQERIRGTFPSPLVQPHRRLINDGALNLCRVLTRVPSFNVSRDALLGEVNGLDSFEESILLRHADVQLADPEPDRQMVTQTLPELQICHLERHTINRRVHLILCNDITVIIGEEEDGPVDLLAVLRVTGPARIVNGRIIRITDPKHILYLEATSPQEAEKWRQALTLTSSPTQSAGQNSNL